MRNFLGVAVSLAVSLFLVGCDKHDIAGDGHHHGEGTRAGASFKAGTGVFLTEETRLSIGLTTADVAERSLPLEFGFHAQVFGENHKPSAVDTEHAECTAKLSGLLGQEQAALLHEGQPVQIKPKASELLGGYVSRVNKSIAIGDAEVVIGVTNAGAKLKPGEFVFTTIAIPRAQSVVAVPQSAVLRAADGTFVYAVNGDAFFRTPVRTGPAAAGFVEITDGLFPGDVVVTHPVEKLWLIELRATKGGGHSH